MPTISPNLNLLSGSANYTAGNLERNQIATAQFAVDSKIEQRKLSASMVQL
jgi:hypothetical protein